MSERFAQADGVLRTACGGEFTGAVARVEHRGRPVFERAYGVTRADVLARPVYVDTRFDLASLTKLFVATVVLELVARGALELDRRLVDRFPEWRGNAHAPITVRMLLAHVAGLQSGADYRTLLDQRVAQSALTLELAAVPGSEVIYSDLGFIVLGELIERVTDRSLASLVTATFARVQLGYHPAPALRATIPATEDDGWRGRVQGVVHDEKAYLMGGAAGHAGLFGTAADVTALAQNYLGPVCGRSSSVLPAVLASTAIAEAAYDPVLRRGLGWALKTSETNSCGRRFSEASFGHTGFVGTCVWADPERDLVGVLLTNTVYFGRSDTRPLRAAFYDAVVGDLER